MGRMKSGSAGVQFSVARLLLSVAAFCAGLGVMVAWKGSDQALLSFLYALAIGVLAALLNRGNLGFALATLVGSAIGTLFGLTCLAGVILKHRYIYDHGYGETAKSMFEGACWGAIVGGLVGSWIARRCARC